jgi:hypothetical protein
MIRRKIFMMTPSRNCGLRRTRALPVIAGNDGAGAEL